MDNEELKQNLKNFLDNDGKIVALPAKRKLQIMVVFYLSQNFEKDKIYTEKQVNEILNAGTVFKDPATLRRDMIDLNILTRDDYCKEYKLANVLPDMKFC